MKTFGPSPRWKLVTAMAAALCMGVLAGCQTAAPKPVAETVVVPGNGTSAGASERTGEIRAMAVPPSPRSPSPMAAPVPPPSPSPVAAPVGGAAPAVASRLSTRRSLASAAEAPAEEAPSAAARFEGYKVVLGVDAVLKLPGTPGELRVWIGSPAAQADMPADMKQASSQLAASGATAKVTPFAPGFKVEPRESVCARLNPQGSTVRFALTPEKQGDFEVSADVQLFDSDDCSGTPNPQAATRLKVQVVVDKGAVLEEHKEKLSGAFWDQVLDFWKALLGLVSGLILFLIRGRLKTWFGFDKGGEG